jgi:glutathione S-transferase
VPVFWSFWRTPEADRDMDLVVRNLRDFEQNAGIAMAERGDAPWIMGEEITLVDIWAGHVLYRYFTLDLPHRPPDGLADYYAALTERPHYAEHVMIDYSELKAGPQA